MTREELLEEVCLGDGDALAFLRQLIAIVHAWDDLIDRDREMSPEAINEAFSLALFALPNNEFYKRHFALLNPVMLSAMNNWYVANQLEAGDDEADKRIAFITRSSYVDVVTQVAHLIGGPIWVKTIGPEIRRLAHSEGWEGYLRNLKAEQDARARSVGG